jgi:hypothetical protein
MRPKPLSTPCARIMMQLNGDDTTPSPTTGKSRIRQLGANPWSVLERDLRRAIYYTRTYGLVERVDDQRVYHDQWFPAGQTKRVDAEPWRGRRV